MGYGTTDGTSVAEPQMEEQMEHLLRNHRWIMYGGTDCTSFAGLTFHGITRWRTRRRRCRFTNEAVVLLLPKNVHLVGSMSHTHALIQFDLLLSSVRYKKTERLREEFCIAKIERR